MPRLNEISYWSDNLGLLPMKLSSFAGNANDEFILLNGGMGDFCLQTENVFKDPEYYYSSAWSSNTKNFVVAGAGSISIFNWKKNHVETITAVEKIEQNLNAFYEYLSKNNFKTEQDITPFIIDIFKQIRNLTNDVKDSTNSLNLLFLLITTIENADFRNVDYQKWGLNPQMHIPNGFGIYVDKFLSGITNRVHPNLDLILRHSSGMLFQEAHREVVFSNKQLDLWGELTSRQESKKIMYSSIHYTPSYVARSVVEFVVSRIDLRQQSLKIFDPACGSSEFLLEILKQLKSKNYNGHITLVGWDASQIAVTTSLFLLKYQQTLWPNLTIEIKHVEDSLSLVWERDFDIVIMNPPFLSYELMDRRQRESVVETLGTLVSGRPNQASGFIYKAVQSLKTDGLIGCITPASIFSLSAYSKLRKELDEMLRLCLIAKLGNYVFEDALVDVGIFIARKSLRNDILPTIAWALNEKGVASDVLRQVRIFEVNSQTIDSKKSSVYQTDAFPNRNDTWKPISFSENELNKKIERMVFLGSLSRTQDVFDVKLGVRTGKNNVFKISSFYFHSLPKPEQKFFRPVIDNDAVNQGRIEIRNYLWYPYTETDILIRDEDSLKNSASKYYNEVLLNEKDKLVDRCRTDESNWWLLSEPRSWLRKRQTRLVSTEFGRSGSFAVDVEGEFLIERGCAWMPKKAFQHINSNYFYLALFSSPFFDKLLSIYSRQLLSGFDLTKKYTKDIPIPSVFNPNVSESDYYSKLVDIGISISEGSFSSYKTLESIVTEYIYPSYL